MARLRQVAPLALLLASAPPAGARPCPPHTRCALSDWKPPLEEPHQLFRPPRHAAGALTDVVLEEATELLYLEKIGAQLEPALTAVNQVLGAEAAARFLADAPLPALAHELLASGEDNGIDRDGGLGIFRVPVFPGTVGVVAASDAQHAVEQLVARTRSLTAPPHVLPHGALVLELSEGRSVALFALESYVFLAMPDEEVAPGEETPKPFLLDRWGALVEELRSSVESAKAKPLTHAPSFDALSPAGPGLVHLFLRSADPLLDGYDAALFTLHAEAGRLVIDGRVRTGHPLWAAANPLSPLPLAHAAARPLVAGSIAIQPEDLEALLIGTEGTPRRALMMRRAELLDLPLAQLTAGLGGSATLLVTGPAPEHLALAPWPHVQLDATLSHAAPIKEFFEERLADSGLSPHRTALPGGGVRLRAETERGPVVTEVHPDRLHLALGRAPSAATSDLVTRLRERFGADAFGPGHASVLVDLAQVRSLFRNVPEDVLDDPPGRMLALLAVGAVLLSGVDAVFTDVAPDPDGAQLRVTLDLGAGADSAAQR